jgi:vesicle-fusing ATPase
MEAYIVDKLTNSLLAATNCVYTNKVKSPYVLLTNNKSKYLFKVLKDDNLIEHNKISLNLFQRQFLKVELGSKLTKEDVELASINNIKSINSITFIIKPIKTNSKTIYELTEDKIDSVKQSLIGIPVNNELYLSIELNSLSILPVDLLESDNNKIITNTTNIKFITIDDNIKIDNSNIDTQLFNGNFNFIDMGVGGLNKQFEILFRRTFSSRLLPDKVLKNLGINHVRGIMLYGPPGCGKTLIARQIGKILNCETPKIVNGPSLLSSFMGKSEENVRNLFADAIADKGNKKLHLIILDEFDALARKRGTTGPDASVMDKIVNQFLTMIDGPDSLNNILLIAMTNRLDMIDEALLRPGRFEVQIEITLPDEKGRLDILTIHTNKMNQAGYLNNVNLNEIASLTTNFTGAEIESVVKNAVSYSISKELDPNNLANAKNIKPIISQLDFLKSVGEIKPQFGSVSKDIEIITSVPFELYSINYENIYKQSLNYISMLRDGNLLSILIRGDSYTGKTTLACQIAKQSGFNCIKFINSELLLNSILKEQTINEIVNNGYRSDSFILILDCIEKLIEYSPLGNYYNNKVLQTINTLLGKIVDTNKKFVIILTSSKPELISNLGLSNECTLSYNVSDCEHAGNLISKYFKNKKFNNNL